MIRRIKLYLKRREFRKRCQYVPCTVCSYFFDDGVGGKCRLAISLGIDLSEEGGMTYR